MNQNQITIIYDAHVLTQDPSYPEAHAIAFANGKILALDDAALALPGERWDAQGKVLTPGFNDVHSHSVWFGQTLMEVDLSKVVSAQDVYDAVASAEPSGEWIIASGFVASSLGGQTLELSELDRAAAGRPLLIKHNSGHAYTVNTRALELAGIDPAAPPTVEGGEFVRDSAGRCTGLLDENAMRPIQQVLLPESQTEISSALERAHQVYLERGITSVTDAGVAGGWIGHSPREIAAYQAADLQVRTQVMVTMDVLHELDGHQTDGIGWGIDAGIRSGLGNEWLQIGPTKIFTDGSLLGTTAAMTENYECCQHSGYFQGDPELIKRNALMAAGAGWSLALHAIGDAAVDFAIETLEEAIRVHGAPKIPHRIEHGGVVRAEQIDRLAKLSVVLVPQPYFIKEFGDAMAQKLGAKRVELSYPAKRLLDAGMTLPGSSDQPVTRGIPLEVMQAFAQRTTAAGNEYGPADKITVSEALYAYTAGSAAATGWAGRKGQIKPGQLADFVLLGSNPLETQVEALSEIEILATVVGGELRYGSF